MAEWQLMLLLFLGSVLALMALGLPIAFCFILVSFMAAFLMWGGEAGLRYLPESFFTSVTSFTLLPLPLFVLMGEVILYSGIVPNMINALDKWIGRLPGRLSLEAVVAGTVLATVTGASIASAAMLGSALVPEMERRGYKKAMSLGPIMGSAGLAIMIPPTSLGVLLCVVGEISIGQLLIAIIMPGLVMAALFAAYVIIRCWLQPSIAPAYEVAPAPLLERSIALARYVLPLGFIVFMVVGVIFVGIATPSEAAATGALACFILAAAYRRLTWDVAKKSVMSSIKLTAMLFLIIVGADVFSQVLTYTGASQGLVELVHELPLAPILILIAMLVVSIVLGMFILASTIIFITLPIFMPVVHALGFSDVWFGVLFLITIEMAGITPPFGMVLFTMKAVGPPDTTLGDCYRAALPFCYLDLATIALIVAFPTIALWLPGLMH